ncbi:MAG TPA: SseB family protein [Nocardioides sp.]|nr:SseB family protein [Nocardioides sp.]
MNERLLQGSEYPDDTGEASPLLAAALDGYAADEARFPDVLAALGASRLLVPVVAVLGEVEAGADGLARDKSSDMATVLLRGADGRSALLAFSSTTTLGAWDPEGRPVPVPTRTAALSAVQEGADALLIDVAGPVTVAVEGDDLRALASGWRLARAGDRVGWVAPAD